MFSSKTQQPVTLSELTRGQRVFRERLSHPDFQTRVLAGDTASLFSEHVVETGMRIAQLPEMSAVPDVVPSVKGETDHTEIWQGGLRGKAFLFPGTGSLAWPRLSAILVTEAFREILAEVDGLVRANLDYGTLPLATCKSAEEFAQLARSCLGIDQICNYLVSVHCAALLDERGDMPQVVIGHSACELSGLALG